MVGRHVLAPQAMYTASTSTACTLSAELSRKLRNSSFTLLRPPPDAVLARSLLVWRCGRLE